MKDNEDQQVNDTHIDNCFNQTISEFVFCKRAATDVLRTTSLPLNTTPSVTATDRLQTVKPRGLSHADRQLGAFLAIRPSEKLGKLVPCKGSRQHAVPAEKGVFYMSKGLVVPLDWVHEVVRAFELSLAR